MSAAAMPPPVDACEIPISDSDSDSEEKQVHGAAAAAAGDNSDDAYGPEPAGVSDDGAVNVHNDGGASQSLDEDIKAVRQIAAQVNASKATTQRAVDVYTICVNHTPKQKDHNYECFETCRGKSLESRKIAYAAVIFVAMNEEPKFHLNLGAVIKKMGKKNGIKYKPCVAAVKIIRNIIASVNSTKRPAEQDDGNKRAKKAKDDAGGVAGPSANVFAAALNSSAAAAGAADDEMGPPRGKPAVLVRDIVKATRNLQQMCQNLASAVNHEMGVLPPGIAGWAGVPPMAQPKLLVLDLNGFLIHREIAHHGADACYNWGDANDATWSMPDAMVGQFKVWIRPHGREFLQWCLQHFAVGIWSSAKYHNIRNYLPFLGLNPELLAFVWGQEQCTDAGPDPIGREGKRLMYKDLAQLWNVQFQGPVGSSDPPPYDKSPSEIAELPDLPAHKAKKPHAPLYGMYGPSTTLLIDDDYRKCWCNPSFTAVHPTPWSGDRDDNLLAPGSAFVRFLESCGTCDDLRRRVYEFACDGTLRRLGLAHVKAT